MTHIGVISTPVSGHLNPMTALGRELKQRGHQVTFFQMPDVEEKVRKEGLDFWAIGESDHPLGSLPKSVAELGKRSGLEALRFTIKAIDKTTTMICRDAPNAIKNARVEILLVDQQEPAGASVAEHMNIPFVSVANALAINQEAQVPPFFTSWNYQKSWYGSLRNQIGYWGFEQIFKPINSALAEYRRQWNLPVQSNLDDYSSKLAQISQQTSDFDFPRQNLPPCFHYTGPFRNLSPNVVPFPYEKLTGQPLIYASLGTLQNRKQEIFHCIAAACKGLDAQLVLSLGGGGRLEDLPELPGSPLVVEYAPQLDLLTRATLTITHAGLNTVLESLSNGVPMVAIPITNDQPGVGARLSWTGAGEVLSLNSLNISNLKTAVQKVFKEESYRIKACQLQDSIRKAGGAPKAADIIEQVIETRSSFCASDFK